MHFSDFGLSRKKISIPFLKLKFESISNNRNHRKSEVDPTDSAGPVC